MAKMDVHRQAEVVSAVLAMPAPCNGHGAST
jgi:hypothetical protein